jgi:hypothetical protein
MLKTKKKIYFYTRAGLLVFIWATPNTVPAAPPNIIKIENKRRMSFLPSKYQEEVSLSKSLGIEK